MKKSGAGTKFRYTGLGLTLLTAASMTLLPVDSAYAYHLNGCKMPSTTVTYFNAGGSVRDYQAIFDQDAGDWTATATPISFSRTYSASFLVQMTLVSNGMNNIDGVTTYPTQPCSGGTNWVSYVTSSVNRSITDAYPSSKVRDVMGHELGHALGLNHQDTSSGCPYVTLMATYTSARYDTCGITTPRADDVAGVNAIY